MLRLRPGTAALRPGAPDSPIGRLDGGAAEVLRFAQGDELQVTISNELSAPTHLKWLGIDGARDAAALAGPAPLAPGGRIAVALPLRQAGTFLVTADPLGDGAPPCSARALVVAERGPPRPIARIVMADAAPVRPAPLPPADALPAPDLPARLDLKGALRITLTLASNTSWLPAMEAAAVTPAFRAARGRTVVLPLSNPSAAPVVFRLNGHHMRLLDRLDDGWKPFWLDTLLVGARQTERVAFSAEHAGRWLMEATALDWAAPKLAQGYAVD